MHALILAGGFATRLWPLTEKTAKPLIPLAGKPLINFLVEKIPNNIPITVSTNAVFADDFECWKNNMKKKFPQKKIDIFIEDSQGETEKKGALAATALCIQEKKIQTNLLLLAGDNYFGFEFSDFFDAFRNTPLLAAYDIGSREKAKPFGVVVPHTTIPNQVLKFEEKPENPSSQLISTGAYIFPQHFLGDIIEYSRDHADDLGGIFEYCMAKGQIVEYFPFHDKWYDIGSFTAFLESNIDLLAGKNVIDSSGTIDKKSNIKENVILQKNVTLNNVTLENTIVLEGSTLTNMSLKNCVIGKNCILENTDFYQKIIRDETILIREFNS